MTKIKTGYYWELQPN